MHSRLLLRVLPAWSTARLRTRNFSQLHRVADTGGLMATFWRLIGFQNVCLWIEWDQRNSIQLNTSHWEIIQYACCKPDSWLAGGQGSDRAALKQERLPNKPWPLTRDLAGAKMYGAIFPEKAFGSWYEKACDNSSQSTTAHWGVLRIK